MLAVNVLFRVMIIGEFKPTLTTHWGRHAHFAWRGDLV